MADVSKCSQKKNPIKGLWFDCFEDNKFSEVQKQ